MIAEFMWPAWKFQKEFQFHWIQWPEKNFKEKIRGKRWKKPDLPYLVICLEKNTPSQSWPKKILGEAICFSNRNYNINVSRIPLPPTPIKLLPEKETATVFFLNFWKIPIWKFGNQIFFFPNNNNGILYNKIVLTYCEKKIVLLIYPNLSKQWKVRSEQFLVTECFFNLFPKVSHI